MHDLNLQLVVYGEGEHHVAQCLSLDVSSFGDTEDDAVANLHEALELYLEDAPGNELPLIDAPEVRTLTLERALEKRGLRLRLSAREPRQVPHGRHSDADRDFRPAAGKFLAWCLGRQRPRHRAGRETIPHEGEVASSLVSETGAPK
jgi:predicted RNase H-like HicB family nuclease